MTCINTLGALFTLNRACVAFLAVETVSNGSIFTIPSRFRLFWALEAVRAKTKETIGGIKVPYDIYKHSKSVVYSK
jgi:hypothetical protein